MQRIERSLLLIVLALSSILNAQTLHVNEAKLRVRVEPDGLLEFPVNNPGPQPIAARFTADLLNTDDVVLSTVDSAIEVAPGSHTIRVPWPTIHAYTAMELSWDRIRYRVTWPGHEPLAGIVQGSRAISSIRLTLVGQSWAFAGSEYVFHVLAQDSVTGSPLVGLKVEAKLEDKELRPSVTDHHGVATFRIAVPKNVDSPTIAVKATRGGIRDEASLDIETQDINELILSTDKQLYRPGQTIHFRVLAFGADHHALSHQEVEFTLEDEQGTTQLETTVTTSRFGIAAGEWAIPSVAPLGRYELHAQLAGNDDAASYRQVSQFLRVSQYDLPNFLVNASSASPYFLPGQKPLVRVTADYLFGKPVLHARVRVVRETQGEWNPEKRRYERVAAEEHSGEFGPDHSFSATFEVGDDFADLQSSSYQRFRDLDFAAFVTDLTTNRTEQRRFKVRITKEPIHLYLTWNRHPRAQGRPPALYVTASYADGRPFSGDVEVSAEPPDASGKFPDDYLGPGVHIARLHTNRYGVARLTTDKFPSVVVAGDGSDAEVRLRFSARDRAGLHGQHDENISYQRDDSDSIELTTDHRLYQPNEAVEIDVHAPHLRHVTIEAYDEHGFIADQTVAVEGGEAAVPFPYDPRFRGSVSFVAYSLEAEDPKDTLSTLEVIFPARQDLGVAVQIPQKSYKPGETASVSFRLRNPLGNSAEGALGIVVFDQAVAERVRTDEDFRSNPGFSYPWRWWWGVSESIGGIGYQDLLKQVGPFDPDVQLVAEALLADSARYGYALRFEREERWIGSSSDPFRAWFDTRLKKVRESLQAFSGATQSAPRDLASLRELLAKDNIDPERLRDPWDRPYHVEFSFQGPLALIILRSDGQDKQPGTHDDEIGLQFSDRYFSKTAVAIQAAQLKYVGETGKQITDYATLRNIVLQTGTDLDNVRDPWGHPYRYEFDVSGPVYRVTVRSAGPNGVFEKPDVPSDDVLEDVADARYFQRESDLLLAALGDHFSRTQTFPTNRAELQPVLDRALAPEQLVDPWGHPYHFEFRREYRYGTRAEMRAVYPQALPKDVLLPVTQTVDHIDVLSYGPQNDEKYKFLLASFQQVIASQAPNEAKSQPALSLPQFGGRGAIRGTVVDPQGAVMAGMRVVAKRKNQEQDFETTTRADGTYVIDNLPTDFYTVTVVGGRDFRSSVYERVPVYSGSVTTVDFKVTLGSVETTVEVSAEAPMITTTEAQVSSVITNRGASPGASMTLPTALFTPRLRKDFPETLYWQPELVTDTHGRAHVDIKLADNITTWQMSVLGSTTDGTIGLTQTSFRAFQPFFVENDPPAVLTRGDSIALPVTLRNYTDKPQSMQVELTPAPWFESLSSRTLQLAVPPSDSTNAVFSFRAVSSTTDGKERVTAHNANDGDAVEKSVTVHPDGREIGVANSVVGTEADVALPLELPSNLIAGSQNVQLKIYPNLSAHVLEAVHAIMERPYGCGEQTISSTYASIFALQLLAKRGEDDPDKAGNLHAPLARLTHKYAQEGFDRLLSYRATDGGFTYWGRGTSSNGLSAYALQFLADLQPFVHVDTDIIDEDAAYLVKAQAKDGSWSYNDTYRYLVPDAALTAYITRQLAQYSHAHPEKKEVAAAIERAFGFLEKDPSAWTSPYFVANYALSAARDSDPHRRQLARKAIDQLKHADQGALYWTLESNATPFYGSGSAGVLETTGLVTQALFELAQADHDADALAQARLGLLFLMRHQDRFGIWYSTHATVDVLHAVIAGLPTEGAGASSTAHVVVNSQDAGTLAVAANSLDGPVYVDIGRFLRVGKNEIHVTRPGAAGLAMQLAGSYYVPWDAAGGAKPNGGLALTVGYDKPTSKIGDTVRCTLHAERIGFRGYGMMLAEVGLPPGADVDRAALEEAMKNSDYDVQQYEVRPDRIVLYLWPRAGGTTFSFDFRSRYGIDAKTAPSELYDYYNPDLHVVLPPTHFQVN